ncbi:CBS domain-containing protein [Paractinoplanes maris]|uniref:CBS domain-containing protein n=1 Tax=Paractinoplanes maris TaxID=1734446 RepID=UPI002021C39D|nr:CBS domain-containing protein [Actinoplanes maris]
MHWQVDDVMTHKVTTVDVDTPVGQIASLLEREGISAVPVTVPTGGVVGVVSQADLLVGVAKGERDNARGGRPKGKATAPRARDMMTTPAMSIGPAASLTQAARTMQDRKVRRLLVTSPQGRLLGVVSRGDVLRPYARTDAEMRREVEAELRRRMWIYPDQVGVRVAAGAVTLIGAVGRRSTADIITRVVTAVPGVTAVANRIRYDFDDADLVRSNVSRTHPFSAEPFHPGKQRRRGRIRLTTGSRRRQRQDA